ncbi:MAG TPA: Gfo/Idh/MocA family oxidoreductase [Verrucomicrobiae bacterium]|nr:Gfo/Idh/MocA family oxidoreductase [Verrucomicrobiae bacterium]
MNRRKFIYGATVSAATTALSARSWSQVAGANDDLRAAVIGFNGRGKEHISEWRRLKGVRLVALCDADQAVLDREINHLPESGSIQTYTDLRKLFENKDIDVVSIATPNHWHSLAAIWAIQAGKDVYCEKPVSHEVWEGRKLVEAARNHNKIVQTGTQIRSAVGVQEGIKFIRDGNLGKIKLARGLCYKYRGSIGKVSGPQEPPKTIDYDLWCGPAPLEPLMRKNLHYDWHWVWSTGNGDLGNQGIHQMDIARWALGVNALSPRVFSIGGRLGYEDDGQTPNTQIVYHDYPEAPLIFEVRGLPSEASAGRKMDQYKGADVGNVIECEGGHVLIPNYSSAIVYDKDGQQIKKFEGGGNHFQNFLEAVRSRKRQELHAEILEGHLSSALCHTGNISYRLGQQKSPDEIREAIKDDKEAAETFGRMQEHLAANEIDLKKNPATLGVFLKMNPNLERFIDNDDANKMLKRDYRKPYVVPDRV